MKFLYSWLREFWDDEEVPTPYEVVDILESIGIEVENFQDLSKIGDDKLVVGRVVEVSPHPRSDRLRVIKLWIGGEKHITQVSGFERIEVGQNVVVALPGAVLPGVEEVVQERNIRGVLSFGMLVSEKELGIGIEEESIILLPPEAIPGERPHRFLGLDDFQYEIYPPTNRGDFLGILGIAREISAKYDKEIKIKIPDTVDDTDLEETDKSVHIIEPLACPRYVARVVEGVKVKESNDFIKRRLFLVGIKPINNIVDITNYVMVELGEPLHAFDLDKISGGIVVRFAKEGEKILTLDGEEKILGGEILCICDERGPIAIAGVIGGESTKIDQNTTNVLLEAAHFIPNFIRMSSSKLGIQTESSRRFSRGVDFQLPLLASKRAAYLMWKYAGGRIRGSKDVVAKNVDKRVITTTVERIEGILGFKVREEDLKSILMRLGYQVKSVFDLLEVEVPYYRMDVEYEEDLAEDYVKILGYENIPSDYKMRGSFVGAKPEVAYDEIREIFKNLGFTEVITIEFTKEFWTNKFLGSKLTPVRIKNPLGKDFEFMRTSLVPGLIEVASLNVRRGNNKVKIFQIGKVFDWRGEENLPQEIWRVSALVTGKTKSWWDEKPRNLDLFDLKVLMVPFEGLSVESVFHGGEIPGFEQGALIYHRGEEIGVIGLVNEEIVKPYDIDTPVYVLEMEANVIREILRRRQYLFGLERFPPVKRDLSIVVDDKVSYGEIETLIHSLNLKNLKEFFLIDFYKGPPIQEGKKSFTFRFHFLNPVGTLTQEEVSKEMERLIEFLKEKGVVIRGVQ